MYNCFKVIIDGAIFRFADMEPAYDLAKSTMKDSSVSLWEWIPTASEPGWTEIPIRSEENSSVERKQ